MTFKIINFKEHKIAILKIQKKQNDILEKLNAANLKIEAQIIVIKQEAKKNIGLEWQIKLHMRLKQLVNQYQANKYLIINKYGRDNI